VAHADGTHVFARRRTQRRNTARALSAVALGATLVCGLTAEVAAQDGTTTPPTTTTTTTAAPVAATTTTTTTTVPFDPNDFSNGEAHAAADTFVLNIKQANANIGITFGRALSTYVDATGSSEARALDLGVLPTLMGVEQCDGSAPVLNPATFPPLTRADSTDAGSQESRRAEAFMPGTGTDPAGPSAGFQDATASTQPASRAVTETPPTDLFVVALSGARTEVTTQLTDMVREAHAVVTADELKVFGGLFTFENPRWEAVARSGRVTTAEGRFTFSRATVLGIPRSAADAMADLEGFSQGLEQLLAPLGVALDLPAIEVTEGRVRVTPMAFRIVDPPFGAEVIAPFLADLQPLRESLIRQALDEDCKNETAILLLDVILGVASGSGSIEITAGGVDVRTDDTEFPAPLPPAAPLALPPPPAPPPTVAGVAEYDEYTPGSYTPGTAGSSGRRSGSLAPLPLPESGIEALPVEEVATEERAERFAALPSAAGSRFEDTDAGAVAVLVGLAALIGAFGLTVGERALSRRSRRRIP